MLKKAAKGALDDAQVELGERYHYGHRVAQSSKEAAVWYRLAADQGHANTQYCLGEMYSEGDGVSQDRLQAVQWWQKAARQGHASALRSLSWAYESGHGINKNRFVSAILSVLSEQIEASEGVDENASFLLAQLLTDVT